MFTKALENQTSLFLRSIISPSDRSRPQTQMVLTLSFCAANKKNSAQVIVQNANVAAFHTKARPLSEPFKCCQEAERAKRSCSHSITTDSRGWSSLM